MSRMELAMKNRPKKPNAALLIPMVYGVSVLDWGGISEMGFLSRRYGY